MSFLLIYLVHENIQDYLDKKVYLIKNVKERNNISIDRKVCLNSTIVLYPVGFYNTMHIGYIMLRKLVSLQIQLYLEE